MGTDAGAAGVCGAARAGGVTVPPTAGPCAGRAAGAVPCGATSGAATGAAGATIQTDAIISDTIPVEVGFTAEGWFSIRIPALLPKKASGSADYIRSYLYPAMRKFFEGKPPVRFRDCVLAYRHVYDRSRPERAMRDHDNIETNMVTDILALYVLPDDHPAVCSHYYCSAAGSEDRTEVYVIPKHDFPVWMVEEKTLPDKGVKLYEVRFC